MIVSIWSLYRPLSPLSSPEPSVLRGVASRDGGNDDTGVAACLLIIPRASIILSVVIIFEPFLFFSLYIFSTSPLVILSSFFPLSFNSNNSGTIALAFKEYPSSTFVPGFLPLFPSDVGTTSSSISFNLFCLSISFCLSKILFAFASNISSLSISSVILLAFVSSSVFLTSPIIFI